MKLQWLSKISDCQFPEFAAAGEGTETWEGRPLVLLQKIENTVIYSRTFIQRHLI